MECTILLNKNRNLVALGDGRISIVLRKHISRGRGKCAQRHGRIVGGNGHVLGAARHHLTGGLIHKLDGDGHRFGLLGIDGVEGQITFFVVLVPFFGLIYQLGQCTVRKETIILILAIRIERPASNLLVAIARGRSSRSIFFNSLRNADCCHVRITEADLDRPAELRRSFLIIGLIVVVLVLGPGGVDRNVVICEGHIARQKRHIGRFLRRRSGGSIAVLSVRPSQEDNPVVLGAKRITTLQSGRIAGIVLLGIGNVTARAIGIVGQCVRFLLVVRDLVAVVIDRIVHIKDLLIRVPDEILAGFLGVQHVGVLGIISSKLIGALVVDRLIADFLSSPRIHRIRLSYNSLRIYPEVVDGVAVLCLNGRNEGTLCHVDGCNQLSVELFGRNGPIRKIHGNRVQRLAANPAEQRKPPGAGFGIDRDCVDRFLVDYVGGV